jgi:glycosidase
VARSYHSDAKPEGVIDLGEQDDKTATFKSSNNFYYLPGQSFRPPSDYSSLGSQGFTTKDKSYKEDPAKATGNDQFTATPSINDWFETVKLNYGVDILDQRKTYFDPIPDTWVKMKDILIFWAKKNVDGFRCDMAEMVPVEFWHWAIPQVKAVNSKIIFIAEIYNPNEYRNYINQGQFDFLYDKVQLYDTLRLMINQQSSAMAVPDIQRALNGINDKMLHFLENHDEQRLASRFFAGDPWKAVPAMAVSALIDRGPIMIYFGQEVGEPGLGDKGFGGEDGRTTIYDYWGVPEHQKWVNNKTYDGGGLSDEQKQLRQFYGDILNFAKTNPAIAGGEYVDLTTANVQEGRSSDRVVVFGRVSGNERLVIVAGFNDKLVRIKVRLTPDAVTKFGLQEQITYVGRDLLRSGTDVGLNEQFEFEVDVPPYSAFIFKIKE